jgi:hypothetical protein
MTKKAMCVKGKAPTTYAVLGLGYGGGLCLPPIALARPPSASPPRPVPPRDGQGGYLHSDEICWVFPLFWLNLDKRLR